MGKKWIKRTIHIVLIQIFFLSQLNVPGVFSTYNPSVYELLRRIKTVEVSLPEAGENDPEIASLIAKVEQIGDRLAPELVSFLGKFPQTVRLTHVKALANSLAELSITYGITEEELKEYARVVLENVDLIMPGLRMVGIFGEEDFAYILPWLRVAVEIGIREKTLQPQEIKDYFQEIMNIASQPNVVQDVQEILGVGSLDFTNPIQVAELAEYSRLILLQNKMEEILRNKLGERGVEKYQGLLGVLVQTGNWLQSPQKIVLDKFTDLISGISSIERKVAELTGDSSSAHVIPWIAFGLIEGLYTDLKGTELVDRLVALIELSKNSELQTAAAVNLGIENPDFSNQDYVLYLALNAKVEWSQRNIKGLLDARGVGSPALRDTLATYLVSLSQVFGTEEEKLVVMAEESFRNVSTVLDDIGRLCGKDITLSDEEILPWIWLDMVLRLDPEAKGDIKGLLSKVDETRLREVANYLLNGEFNPADVSHIALLVPMAELVGSVSYADPVETSPPISLEELKTVVGNENVKPIIEQALDRVKELFTGQRYDLDKVRQALVFMTLITGWSPGELIPGLTDIELQMAKSALGQMEAEEIQEVYFNALNIVRDMRRSSIDTALPPRVEPSGFNWRAALFRLASTILSAGLATGVYLAGGGEPSSLLFRLWLGFLTYVNVKPIVELGLSGILDMVLPHQRAAEVESIIEEGVPADHKGMIVRQMYVVKDSQLAESVLLDQWLRQQFSEEELKDPETIRRKIANGEIRDPNIKQAIVIDVDTEEFRQKTIDAYNMLLQKYPGLENYVFLFIRNKGNWQFKEGYNRKEGRIDDLLSFIYKALNQPETHLEGSRADLRARDRRGNIRILGDNFYIDGKTRELKDSSGNVIRDSRGRPITEDRIKFEYLYEIRDGKLYGAYGNLIAGENEFIVDREAGIIRFLYTSKTDPGILESIPNPYTKPFKEVPFVYLLDEGRLYKGSQLISSSPDFIGGEGQIMVDALNGEIIRDKSGKIIRGNYIGLDLRRDPFEPLFSYIAGNIKELGIVVDESGQIVGVDETGRIKYIFVIDEDTTLPTGTIRQMIAKFAHPDNRQYVIMQPALKNTNAYTSQFTRIDTLAREMLRFSEYTNWRIFGGIMYGKWGARVEDYYRMLVEKEIADPTARSEDERPTLYVPVLGLTDVFWGDEPKATLYQFLARMTEWTMGDIQTLLKEYLPRILWGVPYRIYSAFTGREYTPLPRLSAQGQRILTNLARSIYMPPAFATLLASYFIAGSVGSLYTLTGVGVSNLISAGIVFGAIIGLGKWLAPIIRDLREEGFQPADNLRTIWEDTQRAWNEFWWSTGLYIPFIWLKSVINWRAYQEIKTADMQMRMVPRTPGVIISEMEKIKNIPASYQKLLPSPIIGALAIADLAIVNPMALLGFAPTLGYAFLFQPTLAFLTEATTQSLAKAIENIEKNPLMKLVGDAFKEVYASKAAETMADEKLDRILGIGKARALRLELKFERFYKLLESNPSAELETILRDSIWGKLSMEERTQLASKFGGSESLAKDAVYTYLKAIYQERAKIEQSTLAKERETAQAIQAFKIRAYAQALISEYPERTALVNAARKMYELMDDIRNVTRLDSIVADLIRDYRLSVEDAELLKEFIKLARS
ncbi:MAG: hypothetical protein AB7E08_00070 [Candidatus Omnitrophota bacterium]